MKFVAQLSNQFESAFEIAGDIVANKHFRMSITLNQKEFKVLYDFSRGQHNVRVQEAHMVLTEMVREVKHVNIGGNGSSSSSSSSLNWPWEEVGENDARGWLLKRVIGALSALILLNLSFALANRVVLIRHMIISVLL